MSRMIVQSAVVLCLLALIITPISSVSAFEMEGTVDRASSTFGLMRKTSLQAVEHPKAASEGMYNPWVGPTFRSGKVPPGGWD
jgi:hypothetical protein